MVGQDMPPQGGYPEIRYKFRGTPRGPSGLAIFAVSGAMILGGFFMVGQTNYGRKMDKNLNREARQGILSVLMAEEDLRYVYARRNGQVTPNVYKTPGLWFPPTK
uniref:NADH dehydrogenase [ubiquinone] 1 alpha subcomplex subunit 13 n=1 Tax=Octactis speculum TaxID=3111310 RepID=A0A7S2GF35_9STRA|mmetsp:Transcript_46419/g.63225  ORF Transcript_46419/g.63225 Transcript_46419/m.63225 type:complete len:105 (+) Transcript_46419:45-359(+)|eukprot:CAMPEP_0185765612 /NCGR_PEP_ID=MMETSP1174-20130828/30889_1 /TAXON_ID=35687 /ORGANISM="Dictyocha speculum, Strain CCMP1381" /LENGTH=104 /DNA_ID=CAMNT_0028448855 /DNA_START=44 /DNA_END=358 /DNA_ORIENTATION=+